ncbi:hypothetical protein CXG81DRAFT_6414, partial [Caulochytrium protostelioides]
DAMKLPSIVVIGSQSSGKSSVLEALVGHAFLPKGKNMVTRRPIELTLIHCEDDDAYGEFPQLGQGRITSFAAIQKILTDLNLAVPAAECISREPIELRLYSRHVPDLKLVDLPGYIQISTRDQPEALKDRIAELCEEYIKAPNVILAVCAADVDLANAEALRASRRVDPRGDRTIGVLTKMDLIDPQHGHQLLRGDQYPLALGYVGVICKPQAVASAKGQDAETEETTAYQTAVYQTESQFFAKHYATCLAPGSGSPALGMRSLREILTRVLTQRMYANLQILVPRIQDMLEETRYEYKVQYNDRVVSPASYLADLVDAAKRDFRDVARRFGRAEVRAEVQHVLDERLLRLLNAQWYQAGTLEDLRQCQMSSTGWLGSYRSPADQKLATSTVALTKSGVGRQAVQVVVQALLGRIAEMLESPIWAPHDEARHLILETTQQLLKRHFAETVNHVETAIKPFKFEVECTAHEWGVGRAAATAVLEAERDRLMGQLADLRSGISRRTMRAATDWIVTHQPASPALLHSHDGTPASPVSPSDSNAGMHVPYAPSVMDRALETLAVKQHLAVLEFRLRCLRSSPACTRGASGAARCPEPHFYALARKLTNTAVLSIQTEMLHEFVNQFPRTLDTILAQQLGGTPQQLRAFAAENRGVRAHLECVERLRVLEEVMRRL